MFVNSQELIEYLYKNSNKNYVNLLSLEELDFMFERMFKSSRRNYGIGILPYVTSMEKQLSDSIAKKLKCNKFYRGSRPVHYRQYNKPSHTLKENAVAVALYNK